ncbi:MAG: hypothetical protein AAFV19_13570 [Pseudomonadota bacterium]
MTDAADGTARDRIPDPVLADLIDHAYQAFKVPPPGDLALDKPYSIPPETEARMLAAALDEHTAPDLAQKPDEIASAIARRHKQQISASTR